MIFSILAPLAVAVVLSLSLNKKLVYTIPLTICGMILVLNVMAVCGILNAIDYFSAAVCVAAAIFFARKRDQLPAFCTLVCNPSTYLLLASYLAIAVLYWTMQVTNGDDFIYWATAVKSLFYRGSVEPPYRNVSVAFGDYPLGVQSIQWWFMHLAGKWEERWLFIAHNFITYSFLAPLFAEGKKGIHRLAAFLVLLLLIPYTSYGFYDDLSVDSCLAAVYTYAILLCIKQADKTRIWELALVLATLPMIKAVGILWACFAWIFWLLLNYHSYSRKESITNAIVMILPAVAVWQLWSKFCGIWGRSYYLMENLVSRNIKFDAEFLEIVKSFLQGTILEPYVPLVLTGISLSLVAYMAVIVVFLLAMMRNQPREGKDNRNAKILGFLIFSTLAYLLVLLYSDLTIFLDEGIDSAYTASKLGRYGSPLIFALLTVLIHTFMQFWETAGWRKKLAAAVGFILILGLNVQPFCTHLRTRLSDQEQSRPELEAAYERAKPFFAKLEKLEEPEESRILYFDQAGYDQQNNMAVYYYAEGISVVYMDSVLPEDIAIYIRAQDATHVYLAMEGQEEAPEFNHMASDGHFLYNTIYQVGDDMVFLPE